MCSILPATPGIHTILASELPAGSVKQGQDRRRILDPDRRSGTTSPQHHAFMTFNLMHIAQMLPVAGIGYGNQRTKWDAGCQPDFTPTPTTDSGGPEVAGGWWRANFGTLASLFAWIEGVR